MNRSQASEAGCGQPHLLGRFQHGRSEPALNRVIFDGDDGSAVAQRLADHPAIDGLGESGVDDCHLDAVRRQYLGGGQGVVGHHPLGQDGRIGAGAHPA